MNAVFSILQFEVDKYIYKKIKKQKHYYYVVFCYNSDGTAKKNDNNTYSGFAIADLSAVKKKINRIKMSGILQNLIFRYFYFIRTKQPLDTLLPASEDDIVTAVSINNFTCKRSKII